MRLLNCSLGYTFERWFKLDARVEKAFEKKGFGNCGWCSEPLDRSPWHVTVGDKQIKVCPACEDGLASLTPWEREEAMASSVTAT